MKQPDQIHYRPELSLGGARYLALDPRTTRLAIRWRLSHDQCTVAHINGRQSPQTAAIVLRHPVKAQHPASTLAGLAIAAVGFFTATSLHLRITAGVVVAGWLVVYARYRQVRSRYAREEHGWLPDGAWLNPPPEAYEDGDITLTAGNIARDLRNSVGHGETTIVDYESTPPEFYSFSSYMDTGAIINKLVNIADPSKESGLYIVMRPRMPLAEAQRLPAIHWRK